MPEPLSGRFVRVPVEFVDRELHPWMESTVWRDAYVRLQRNRTYKDHSRQVGKRVYHLKEGQLVVSTRWLMETNPEMTEKLARTFLERLEEEGLITYPKGKIKGARVQQIELVEGWTPTQVEKKAERQARRAKKLAEAAGANSEEEVGRTRKPRIRLRRNKKQDQEAEPGRTPEAPEGELEPERANSTGDGANSSTEIELSDPPRGELETAGNGSAIRGFGFHKPFEGELRGRGGIGGEGERDTPERAKALSAPRGADRETVEGLVKFASSYCAPDREGVLPIRGREITELRELVHDVLRSSHGDIEATREFFVRARRWADSKSIERMNATFVRSNTPAIKSHTALTLAEERGQKAVQRTADEERARYEAQALLARWKVKVLGEWEALGEDGQKPRLEAAAAEQGMAWAPELEPWNRAAIKAMAMAQLGEELGLPQPNQEET